MVGVQLHGEQHSVAPVIALGLLFPLPTSVHNNVERWLESNRQESPARHWTQKSLSVLKGTLRLGVESEPNELPELNS